MPTEWVKDNASERKQIDIIIKPKRRPNEVTKPIIKKKGKDPQMSIKGFLCLWATLWGKEQLSP